MVAVRPPPEVASRRSFTNLVKETDAWAARISSATENKTRCEEIVSELTAERAVPKKRLDIHTGVIFPHDTFNEKWRDPERKLRLTPLSFLATQNLGSLKLRFWTTLEPSHPLMEEIFGPILRIPALARSIQVSKFDMDREAAKAFPNQNNLSKALLDAYRSHVDPGSMSDLMRAVILNNYGGAWVDSDVLLIRDMAPIMAEDWAYFGKPDFVNGAVMSTSRPRSPFMQNYLLAVVGHGIPMFHERYYQFGPRILTALKKNAEEAHNTGFFHVLPPCFFDPHFQHTGRPPPAEIFFAEVASGSDIASKRPGSTSHAAFAYHWHNGWEFPIRPGSLADELEQIYRSLLSM